ncbi:ribosome biogenesis atpase rix7 [Brachionus plicatilis]|uniref:Ribosome biogenesis atpase rix7 n=1 Tax=Brachionus plicatilis TaxID=10195 RepID=A0A3M7SBA5_BRAPC|nr:ribosome biogenesis atpase rix7 [Brachionus plicatilis]
MSFSIDSLIASLQARWQISVKSAPLKPWVALAKKSKSTSLEMGDFLKAAFRMFMRDFSSGKGITHGAACLALSNTSRTFASDSPNHMVNNSGPLIDIKLAWHSLAMALASRVLPQPGGP